MTCPCSKDGGAGTSVEYLLARGLPFIKVIQRTPHDTRMRHEGMGVLHGEADMFDGIVGSPACITRTHVILEH